MPGSVHELVKQSRIVLGFFLERFARGAVIVAICRNFALPSSLLLQPKIESGIAKRTANSKTEIVYEYDR
jgi:hypothetical protein